MKEAFEELNLPKEVYDSDGDGDENWKDDIDMMDYEEDANEGKYNYLKGNTEAARKIGRSSIIARLV